MHDKFTLLLVEHIDKSLFSLYSNNTIITDSMEDASYYIGHFNIDSVIADFDLGVQSFFELRKLYNGVLIAVVQDNKVYDISLINKYIDDVLLKSELTLKNVLTIIKRSHLRRNCRSMLNDSKQILNNV